MNLGIDTDFTNILLLVRPLTKVLDVDGSAIDIFSAPAAVGRTIQGIRIVYAQSRQRLDIAVVADELWDTYDLASATDIRPFIGIAPDLAIEGCVAAVDDWLKELDSLFLELAVFLRPLSTFRLLFLHFFGRNGGTKDATLGLVFDVSHLSVEGGAACAERLGSRECISRVGISLIYQGLENVHLLGRRPQFDAFGRRNQQYDDCGGLIIPHL